MANDHVAGVPVFQLENLHELRRDALPEQGALLLIDKPRDWTSFDVVAKTRGMLRAKKVGHTGTLDPMATGLLVICVGKATKLADQIQAEEKEYTGTMRFGGTTPTDDAESEVETIYPVDHLNADSIRAAAAGFVGPSMQRAPIYSARKVGGQRLYKLARKGETVDIPEKPIVVTRFDITDVDLPDAHFVIGCSKGTYIRALARDLGHVLASGAYLTALRRTRNGRFSVDAAFTIQQLQQALEQ